MAVTMTCNLYGQYPTDSPNFSGRVSITVDWIGTASKVYLCTSKSISNKVYERTISDNSTSVEISISNSDINKSFYGAVIQNGSTVWSGSSIVAAVTLPTATPYISEIHSTSVKITWEVTEGINTTRSGKTALQYRKSTDSISNSTAVTITHWDNQYTMQGLDENTTYLFYLYPLVYEDIYYTFSSSGWYEVTTLAMDHPTVTAGSVVTKSQMDLLRSYKNNSPNVVTQSSTINASDGNTYKSGLTAGSTQISATWYNNA